MAIGVYCENCIHQKECEQEKEKLGITTYIKGKVDCEKYKEEKPIENENHA